MGKKRRMIAKRSKFGKKFANHPCVKALQEVPELVETPVEVVEVVEVAEVEEKTVAIEEAAVTKKKKKTAKPIWSRKKKDD